MFNLANGFIRPRNKWGKKKRKFCGIPTDADEFFDWAYDNGIIKTAIGGRSADKKKKEEKNYVLPTF